MVMYEMSICSTAPINGANAPGLFEPVKRAANITSYHAIGVMFALCVCVCRLRFSVADGRRDKSGSNGEGGEGGGGLKVLNSKRLSKSAVVRVNAHAAAKKNVPPGATCFLLRSVVSLEGRSNLGRASM